MLVPSYGCSALPTTTPVVRGYAVFERAEDAIGARKITA